MTITTNTWNDPSEGGALDLDVNDELSEDVWDGVCENLLYIGGSLGTAHRYRTQWLVPQTYYTGSAWATAQAYNYWPAAPLPDGTSGTFVRFSVHPDSAGFDYMHDCRVFMTPANTGVARYGVDWALSAMALQRAWNEHSGTSGWLDTTSMTAGTIYGVSITSLFTATMVAGDGLAINFKRDSSHANDTINGILYVLGVRARWYDSAGA